MLVQAYGMRPHYTDHGMEWHNTGKSGDYAAFCWATASPGGPSSSATRWAWS